MDKDKELARLRALDRILDQQASLDEKIEELKQKLGAAQDARVQLQSRIAEAKEAVSNLTD